MKESEIVSTLARIVGILKELNCRFHLTGGLVSSYYGEPRLTQDIDFVVVLSSDELEKLIDQLQGKYMIDPTTMRDAVVRNSIFQALGEETFIKVDFHVGGRIQGSLQGALARNSFQG